MAQKFSVGDKVVPTKSGLAKLRGHCDLYQLGDGTGDPAYLTLSRITPGAPDNMLAWNAHRGDGSVIGYCNGHSLTINDIKHMGNALKALGGLFKALVNPDGVALRDAGYLNGDLELTDEGTAKLLELVFTDKRAELVAAAKAKLAEEKEAAKKK